MCSRRPAITCSRLWNIVAIQELKKRHYDVILTDYQMPRLNGLELLALSQKLMPETPVILISGAHPSLEQVAIERGAFAWILKPAPVTHVLLIVRAAMEQTRSGQRDAGTDSGSSRSRPYHWSPRLTRPDERGDVAIPALDKET